MIYITGQSRSGTSLMLMLFAFNGLDVGYNRSMAPKPRERYGYKPEYGRGGVSDKQMDSLKRKLSDPDSKALRGGAEFLSDYPARLIAANCPEVIKQPWSFSSRSPEFHLRKHNLQADDVVITRRDPEKLALSQIYMMINRGKCDNSRFDRLEEFTQQVRARYVELASIFPDAIWVDFPRFVDDFDYLWSRVGCLLDSAGRESTQTQFQALVNPDFVRYR